MSSRALVNYNALGVMTCFHRAVDMPSLYFYMYTISLEGLVGPIYKGLPLLLFVFPRAPFTTLLYSILYFDLKSFHPKIVSSLYLNVFKDITPIYH